MESAQACVGVAGDESDFSGHKSSVVPDLNGIDADFMIRIAVYQFELFDQFRTKPGFRVGIKDFLDAKIKVSVEGHGVSREFPLQPDRHFLCHMQVLRENNKLVHVVFHRKDVPVDLKTHKLVQGARVEFRLR